MATDDNSLQVTVEQRGIVTIKLNRPSVRNAFDGRMVTAMTEAIRFHGAGEDTRAIVFTGAGPSFCAGGDLRHMISVSRASYAVNLLDARMIAELFETINTCPVPVIAAVQGAAIGGAIGILAACDVVVSTEDAVFGFGEARMGFVPTITVPLLLQKIGLSQLRRLYVCGEIISAEEAWRISLVHKVVASEAQLHDGVESIIAKILECSPQAVIDAKALLRNVSLETQHLTSKATEYFTCSVLAEMRSRDEVIDAMSARLAKRSERPPNKPE